MNGCDFLTVEDGTNGPVDIPVALGQADSSRDFVIGERTRAWNGSGRSTEQTVKRRWNVTTPPVDAATIATLRAILVPGAPLTIGGALFGTSTITAFVDIERETYIATPGSFLTQLSLTIAEA